MWVEIFTSFDLAHSGLCCTEFVGGVTCPSNSIRMEYKSAITIGLAFYTKSSQFGDFPAKAKGLGSMHDYE
jgi:hypothetical protein